MRTIHRKIFYCFFVMFVLMLSGTFVNVQAEEYVSFSVKAHLPENQLNKENSYFDLRVKPQDEQLLKTEILNHENEEITVKLSVRNATTNQNGMIVYEEIEAEGESNHPRLTELVTFEEEEIVIPGGESKIVSAKLKMPEEEFDGIVLGGLHFEKVPKEETDIDGLAIQNKYAYLIGVVLSENDREVVPELEYVEATADIVNHRTASVITIENKSPIIMEDLTIKAKVYKEDSDLVKETKLNEVNMAPNSTMDVVVDWENHPFEDGKYYVEVKASHPSNTWEWEDSFYILKKDATMINSHAVKLEEPETFNYFILVTGIILIGTIIGLLVYIYKLKHVKK